jgi:hypothetical protein
MATRKRGLGEVKRSAKKARRHLFRVTTSPSWETSHFLGAKKKASIHLEIARTYESGGAYKAKACMLSHAGKLATYRGSGPSKIAYKRTVGLDASRCSVAQGPSPTRAVKRAVIALMKKIK